MVEKRGDYNAYRFVAKPAGDFIAENPADLLPDRFIGCSLWAVEIDLVDLDKFLVRLLYLLAMRGPSPPPWERTEGLPVLARSGPRTALRPPSYPAEREGRAPNPPGPILR